MIQLKEANTIEEANAFMKNHVNCSIIGTNPYIIQYEIEESYSKPIMELKGMPRSFIFVTECKKTNNFELTSGHILVFNDFLLFKGSGKYFVKLTWPRCELISSAGGRTIIKNVSFIDFCEGFGGINLQRHGNDLETFREYIAEKGIVTSYSNLLYHERTNTIMTVGQMKSFATLKSGKIQAEATEKLARATLMAGMDDDGIAIMNALTQLDEESSVAIAPSYQEFIR